MSNNEISDSNNGTKSSQHLEIYKLHFDKMNEMSNRRVSVNRYYILALSVIVLALSALLRSGDFITTIFTGTPPRH